MNKISREDLATIVAIIGAIASILGTLKALISVDPLFGWIALAFVVAGLFWYLAQGQRSVWIIGLLAVLALVSFGAAWWVGPVTVEIATYIDENRNGMCEEFEQRGPAGIEVQLLDSEGVMRVAYTDSRGVATFHGVPQGPYGILKVGPGIGGIASRVIRTAPVAISPTPQPLTDTPTPTPTETSTLTPTPSPTPTVTPTNTPTPTSTPPPDAVVVAPVNLRNGPGTVYAVISILSPGQVLTVTGRIADTTWLQVITDQMQEGWVINRADLVTLNLPAEQIRIVPAPPTPTQAPPPTPPVRVLYKFDDGTTQGWQAAADWPGSETSQSVKPSGEAGYASGALWGNFNFGRTEADWPRATFYVALPSALEDWTSAATLRFDARSLPETGGEIKAAIMVKTEEQGCYYEHREYQRVWQQEEFTTLEFPLNVPYYRNHRVDSGEYNESLIGKDKVLELALVFIPNQDGGNPPPEGRFAGAVLIDNVTLIEQP